MPSVALCYDMVKTLMSRFRFAMAESAVELVAWWEPRKPRLLAWACALMVISAIVWLAYQFWRLLAGEAAIWPGSPVGAVDLRIIRGLVDKWLAGQPVYERLSAANYPPASHILLWPLLGWPPLGILRPYWAATTCLALAWLIHWALCACRAEMGAERSFIILLPLAMYATGATIGNGQLGVHLLPMMLVSATLAARSRGRWRDDILIAFLMLLALAKPSLSAPFFWLILLLPGRIRPALLTLLGYVGITLWAVAFQRDDLLTLVRDWLSVGTSESSWAGSANVHLWLGSLGWEGAMLPASLTLMGLLGWWIWRRRSADLLTLMGVTAIVARLWVYHNWYDDLLLLLPMLALFTIAKSSPRGMPAPAVASILLALTAALALAPGGLFLLPPPWNRAYVAAQVAVWLMDLGFLMWAATPLNPATKGV